MLFRVWYMKQGIVTAWAKAGKWKWEKLQYGGLSHMHRSQAETQVWSKQQAFLQNLKGKK